MSAAALETDTYLPASRADSIACGMKAIYSSYFFLSRVKTQRKKEGQVERVYYLV